MSPDIVQYIDFFSTLLGPAVGRRGRSWRKVVALLGAVDEVAGCGGDAGGRQNLRLALAGRGFSGTSVLSQPGSMRRRSAHDLWRRAFRHTRRTFAEIERRVAD